MNLWIDTRGLSTALTLFGVPPLERLRRTIGKLPAGDRITLSGDASARWAGADVDGAVAEPLGTRLRRALGSSGGTLVAIDGANVIDPRLIRHLGGQTQANVASRGEGTRRAVALSLDASVMDAIPADARDLHAVADALLGSGRAVPLDESKFPAYIDKLRRSLPYWIHAVDSGETRRALERQMFWDNYKGSTDLLTRYVYPPLVWPLTRFCARFHIHPNVVTVVSIILCFASVPFWVDGQWLAGFVCAYAMSVLDSVDGKVARLTLTDSKIGNSLDHGLDQVHPPFWYFAWAWGLGAREWADPLFVAGVWFIVFYVADRLVLMVAKRRLKHALHSSTPLDERVRSIIARRNITMSVMAIALLLGLGVQGFYLVTAWQALTFAWHGWRTLYLGFLTTAHRGVPSP
jgi:phosphatidylglycerophosphate synthase